MRGRGFVCVVACVAASSCGVALQTTDFTDERLADEREPGVVTVVIGNDTPVPIAGVELILDGESLGIEGAEGPLDVTVSPGEHDLVLDVMLQRDGPAMFTALRSYEARVRGQTRVAVDPGCRLTVRATAYAPPLVQARPEIRFYYVTECRAES
jgi:hypothetical protein